MTGQYRGTWLIEEVAQRVEAWYEKLKAEVEPANVGRYRIVDVETGDYGMGDDYLLPYGAPSAEDARRTTLRRSASATARLGASAGHSRPRLR